MKTRKFLFNSNRVLLMMLIISSAKLSAQDSNTSEEILFDGAIVHEKKEKRVHHQDIDAPQAIIEKAVKENNQKIRFTALGSYTSVEGQQVSNHSKGIMNSALYPALKLEYVYKTKNWEFSSIVGRKEISFNNSPDHTIITPNFTLYRFDIMAAYRLGNFTIGPGFGLEDKFFYNVVSSSFVDADLSRDQKYYLKVEYAYPSTGSYKPSIGLKAGFNPKEKTGIYDIQTGHFYSASIKLDHRISENKYIGLEFYLKDENYKTQQLKVKTSEIGLGVSFSFDWGSGR